MQPRIRQRRALCALRLDVGRALALTGPLSWEDCRGSAAEPHLLGDVVLARKDVPVALWRSRSTTISGHADRRGARTCSRHPTSTACCKVLLGLRERGYSTRNLVADNGSGWPSATVPSTLRHLRDCRRTPDDIWRMIGLPGASPSAAEPHAPGEPRQGELIARRCRATRPRAALRGLLIAGLGSGDAADPGHGDGLDAARGTAP
ncbi:MAG: hypothetical protein U1E17_01445 [Geminicoccaceae bacterium]